LRPIQNSANQPMCPASHNDRVPHRQHGAADVRVHGPVPAVRLSGGVRAGRQRHPVRLIGIELGLLHGALFQALPERIFGIMANDTCSRCPSSPSWA
jgi:hypothetical protein